MAKTIDTDRLMSDCGQEVPQPGSDDVDGFIQIRIINQRITDNGRFLVITEEHRIDIFALNRLTKIDQYNQLSLYIYDIFASYLDYRRKEDFCLQLVRMFIEETIEVITSPQYSAFINLPKGTGQAELVRLIISHMTQQKQAAIQDSTVFNDLQKLLLSHLRNHSLPISPNSMSKTLSRAVDQVVKGLPANPYSQG